MVIEGIIDTSVLIDYLRGYKAAQEWFIRMGDTVLAITPVVWMETVQGASNKIKQQRIRRFLSQFPIEHPEPTDNLWAMEQVAKFSLNHNVEFADIMTASIAVRLNVPIYTTNLKHFAVLPDVDERKPY